MLSEGIALLRELVTEQPSARIARARVRKWRACHPGLRADLLIHQPPGSKAAQFDLLLGVPEDETSTIALSWSADCGEPWAIHYADHWASNYLVTVNDAPTTMQDALLYLRSVTGNYPDLMEAILEYHLLKEGVERNPVDVTEAELQDGADRFRAAHSLFTAESTDRWLREIGLSPAQFEELITHNVQREKFKKWIVDQRIEPFFQEHRDMFDSVLWCQTMVPERDSADRLATAARQRGELRKIADEWLFRAAAVPVRMECALRMDVAGQLPVWIQHMSVGAIGGPERSGKVWQVAQVLSRHPAGNLEGPIRGAVAEAVYRNWLKEQRERANVQWHWM